MTALKWLQSATVHLKMTSFCGLHFAWANAEEKNLGYMYDLLLWLDCCKSQPLTNFPSLILSRFLQGHVQYGCRLESHHSVFYSQILHPCWMEAHAASFFFKLIEWSEQLRLETFLWLGTIWQWVHINRCRIRKKQRVQVNMCWRKKQRVQVWLCINRCWRESQYTSTHLACFIVCKTYL